MGELCLALILWLALLWVYCSWHCYGCIVTGPVMKAPYLALLWNIKSQKSYEGTVAVTVMGVL